MAIGSGLVEYYEDYPKEFNFEFTADESAGPEDTLHFVLEAYSAFTTDLIRPVSMDLRAECFSREWGFPDGLPADWRFWYFRTISVPTYVKMQPAWTDAQIILIDEFDKKSLAKKISSLLSSFIPNNRSLVFNWSSLEFRSVSVRLPAVSPQESSSHLLLVQDGHQFEYPVQYEDGAAWVYGPHEKKTLRPPVEIGFLLGDMKSIRCRIAVSWSTWAKSGETGYFLFESAFARIEALGWKKIVESST